MKSLSTRINLTIDKALLKHVDTLAKRDYTSRSDIVRLALLKYIREQTGQPINMDGLVDPGRDIELENFFRKYNIENPLDKLKDD